MPLCRTGARDAAGVYAELYERIPRPANWASLDHVFSDKELRLMMRHNGMLLNTFEKRTKRCMTACGRVSSLRCVFTPVVVLQLHRIDKSGQVQSAGRSRRDSLSPGR